MSHVFHPSQPTPEWVAQANPVAGLIAFWVGELNMYAALSPEHAQALAVEKFGDGEGVVTPVSASRLDRPVVDKAGEFDGTLREWLALKTEAGWLACGVWVEVDLLGDVPAAAPLRAFWVGEHDVYAAHTPEQALELCEGHSGMPETFDLDDVRELTAEELDKPLTEEDGTPCGTMRQMLADKTEPGELVSFE
jgi:hypothetical protein